MQQWVCFENHLGKDEAMIKLFHRRRAINLQNVTLCESCGQVCTPECRAEARYERTRTAMLSLFVR